MSHAASLPQRGASRDLATPEAWGAALRGERRHAALLQHQTQSEVTDISLSSIRIDYDRQAYEAAAVLDRMMEGETFKAH